MKLISESFLTLAKNLLYNTHALVCNPHPQFQSSQVTGSWQSATRSTVWTLMKIPNVWPKGRCCTKKMTNIPGRSRQNSQRQQSQCQLKILAQRKHTNTHQNVESSGFCLSKVTRKDRVADLRLMFLMDRQMGRLHLADH